MTLLELVEKHLPPIKAEGAPEPEFRKKYFKELEPLRNALESTQYEEKELLSLAEIVLKKFPESIQKISTHHHALTALVESIARDWLAKKILGNRERGKFFLKQVDALLSTSVSTETVARELEEKLGAQNARKAAEDAIREEENLRRFLSSHKPAPAAAQAHQLVLERFNNVLSPLRITSQLIMKTLERE